MKVSDFSKQFLCFFIDLNIVKINSSDLTKIDYTDTSMHLLEDQNFVGDDTAPLITHLRDNECESVHKFFKEVVKFYDSSVK